MQICHNTAMVDSLKDLRKSKRLTQSQAAGFLDISLRSYKNYENDSKRIKTSKYAKYCEQLRSYRSVDETHGILSLEDIIEIVSSVLSKRDVNFCYLFGSYAKNRANPLSDVDLIIDTPITGLKFYGLIEELRQSLGKVVDLLKINQLLDNENLLRNVLKEGIKIYG